MLAGLVFSVHGKYEGSYLNELTANYVTPHQIWAKNLGKGPVKAYVVAKRSTAREIIELAQRMDLEHSTVLLCDENDYASTSTYEAPVEGTTKEEKKAELMAKFKQDKELVILYDVPFGILPPELQVRIANFVKNGGGLLTSLPPLKKMIATPLPEISQMLIAATPSTTAKQKPTAYEYGKGRIIVLPSSGMLKGQEGGLNNKTSGMEEWLGDYESSLPIIINSVLWSAGRNPNVKLSPFVEAAPEGKAQKTAVLSHVLGYGAPSFKFNAEGNGNVNLKCRIRQNTSVLSSETLAVELKGQSLLELKLPQLPAGKYYLDIQSLAGGKTDGIACYPFSIESPLGKIELEMADEAIYEKGPINAELKIEKPMAGAGKIDISLCDSPYGRVWVKDSLSLPAGAKSLPISINKYHIPTIAAYLKCSVSNEKGEKLASVSRPIFFPNYDLDTFLECGDSVRNPLIASQMADVGNRWRNGLWGGRTQALCNQRVIPWATNIQIQGDENGIFYPWQKSEDPKSMYQKMGKDMHPYKPEMREWWKEKALVTGGHVAETKKYGAIIYNLGDECGFDYNAGFGPSDPKYFAEFLAKHYGSIEKLNLAWDSSYKNFEEIPHYKLQESKEKKDFPVWFAHRQYMERMYADLYHYLADEIRKVNPNAKVGAEGSSPGDLELSISKLQFWGPYQDKVEGELLRSIGGDRIRTFWWGGYIGMSGGRNEVPIPLWNNLLRGAYDGHFWFQTDVSSPLSNIGADYSFAKYYQKLLPYMNELTNGLAQLLITTPLLNKDIVLYWSHTSNSASQLDPRFVAPAQSLNPLIDYFYETGLNFDFTTKNNLARLKTAKILFLCGVSALNEKEVEAIKDYVKNGGTVVADMNPAMANESLCLVKTNPLAELFGDVLFNKIEIPSPRKASFEAELNGEKISFASERLVSSPEIQFFQVRKYGKGSAVLLNFPLASAKNGQAEEGSFNKMLAGIIKGAGIKYAAQIEGIPMDDRVMRIRTGKGFEIIGLMALLSDTGKTAKITLPKEKYIYETYKGYLGKTNLIDLKLDVPFKCYSVFDAEQAKPVLKLSSGTASPGTPVILDMKANRQDGIYFMQLIDSSGKPVCLRDQVIELRKGTEIPIHFAYTDNPGNYKIAVTDVATGLKNEASINLK